MAYQKSPFYQYTTFSSLKTLMDTVEKISAERRIPVGRLLQYAIDNELDTAKPFNYIIDLPIIEIGELEVYDNQNIFKIFHFMKKNFPFGVGLDTLLLMRREIGIESRSELLTAFAGLLHVRRVKKTKCKNKFYGPDYQFYKHVDTEGSIK